jgi:2-dehydro-3-deoxyphosphogluconate aldolase/(4S)-4-hydroxy-2-oxoglutarate aldolase
MSELSIYDRIGELRVVPVVAIESVDAAVPLADALIDGGLPVAEITFRTAAAADVIRTLRQERPQLLIGAGTVTNPGARKRGRESFLEKTPDPFSSLLEVLGQGD